MSRTEQALTAVVLLTLAMLVLYASLIIIYPDLPLPVDDSSLTANSMYSMLGSISNPTARLYPAVLTLAMSVLMALLEEMESTQAWTPELSLGSVISQSIAKQIPIYISVGAGGFYTIPALTGESANWGLLVNTASAVASASATLTTGMRELRLSRRLVLSIHLGSMVILSILYAILLRSYGQLGMNWLLALVFSLKAAGRSVGVWAQF